MNIENYIEAQYRELVSTGLNFEFEDLYGHVKNDKLREVFATLHYDLTALFKTMNERLPSGPDGAHFWAEPSRELIRTIEIVLGLYNALKKTMYSFEIDQYYFQVITQCRTFLSSSGGSMIPPQMEKIELYYTIPIFLSANTVHISGSQGEATYELQLIGGGSYANVYKYRDAFYGCNFALKRAKKGLSEKELARFKREFDEMKEFSSPYVLQVYRFDSEKSEYIMEYMDCTLDEYVQKKNRSLSMERRKRLAAQVLRGFSYIHSKGRLHRDINPKNVLVKEYDDTPVIKISDFGLVKIPNSTLTTASTEFKGYFNDPSLVVDGFDTYSMCHETYALTRIVCFILTGKTNLDKITDPKLKAFINRGVNPDKSTRFSDSFEVLQALRKL